MSEQNQNNAQEPQQDLNQLLKVRREKLAALQEAGKDPFVITKYDVSCHTAEAKENFDKMVNGINNVINIYIMGKQGGCTHDCSTCGGCH